MTHTLRGAAQAYKLYDAAIAQGVPVVRFTSETGTDMRDRNPDAAHDAWAQAEADKDRNPWYTRVDDADLDTGS